MALVPRNSDQIYANYYARLTAILTEYANLRWSERANLNVQFEIEILPDIFYTLRVRDRSTAHEIFCEYRAVLRANNLRMSARRHFLYRRLVVAYGRCLDRVAGITHRQQFLLAEISRITETMVSEVCENNAPGRIIRIQDVD